MRAERVIGEEFHPLHAAQLAYILFQPEQMLASVRQSGDDDVPYPQGDAVLFARSDECFRGGRATAAQFPERVLRDLLYVAQREIGISQQLVVVSVTRARRVYTGVYARFLAQFQAFRQKFGLRERLSARKTSRLRPTLCDRE